MWRDSPLMWRDSPSNPQIYLKYEAFYKPHICITMDIQHLFLKGIFDGKEQATEETEY